MHAAYLNIDNQKMSKSLNNFFTTREILEKYDADVVRLFMLSGHYRNPINFSLDLMEQAKSGIERMKNSLTNLKYIVENGEDRELTAEEKEISLRLNAYKDKFIEVMDDDFNTADGISVIFDLIRDANTNINEASPKKLAQNAIELIYDLLSPLGILQNTDEDGLDEKIEKMIEDRQRAREEKNFKEADRIRDELKAMGIILEDTAKGVRWKRA